MKRVSRALLGLLLAAVVLPFIGSGVATAASAPAPTLVSPTAGSSTPVNPPFIWSAAAGAIAYRYQVATDSGFGTIVSQGDTVNIRATIASDLPNAPLYWRVASFDATNQLSPFSPAISFTKTPGKPSAIKPLTGDAPLDYPNVSIGFSWTTVPNTSYYRIEIDDDLAFSQPRLLEDNSVMPQYTWAAPSQFNKVLYWRVKAISPQNIESNYSDPQSFNVAWDYRPTLDYPPNQTVPSIEEVSFNWSGGPSIPTVPGARLYDLQVSSDINFNTIVLEADDLRATAYTPMTALPAGDYYWRVRAKNSVGAIGRYSDTSVFRRTWPTTPNPPDGNDTVQLLYPADNGQIIEPNLAWSPARLGSAYEAWFSLDPNFSPGTVTTCTTTHTTLTPYSACGAYFSPGSTYYWKVKPIDQPANIQGIFSARRAFLYSPPLVSGLSPAGGTVFAANVPPVLSWTPITSAQTPITNPPTAPASDQTGLGRYLVQIYKNGGLFTQEYTYNTKFVPSLVFDPTSAQDATPIPTTYTWRVIGVTGVNQLSLTPFGTQSFTVTPPSGGSFQITSTAGVHGVDPPLLTWSPMPGATSYQVYRGVRGTGIFVGTPLNPYNVTMNGYAHTGDNLTTGDYDFFVQAFDKNNASLGTTAVSWFRIDEIPTTNLTLPQDCITNTGCPVLPDTPILDWDPVPLATHYLISIATDVNFTNVLHQYDSDTPYTKLSILQSLPDNQAGSSSYYWYARPCIGNRCGPDANTYSQVPALPSCYTVPNLAPGTRCSPVRAFIKKSDEIQMLSPTPPAATGTPYPNGPPVVTDQITFHWEDYLKTNRNANPSSNQEAARYLIQVATTANFQPGTVIDSVYTDATTYTDTNLYPAGPLWWKVQAIDGSGNMLPGPTNPGQVLKTMTRPTLNQPAMGASVSNYPLFTWQPQPYAYDYQIEVYKNPSQGAQPGNLVNIGITTTFTTSVSPRVGLPPGTYGWRVKYRDASVNDGPWSSQCPPLQQQASCLLSTFTLTTSGVTLQGPADGQLVAPNRPYFTWSQASTPFAYYRFELSNTAGFSGLVDVQNTVTSAYAPAGNYQNGTWYWRVWTVDGNNNLLAVSSVRSIVIGQPGVTFHPMPPARLLDSRNVATAPWNGTPLAAGSPRNLQISGNLPGLGTVVPANATAIIANVTVTGSSAASFLTVYPSDVPTPNASNLNFAAGQTIPNLVTVKLGASGAVQIATAVGTTNVVVDVVGYYDDGNVTGDFFTGMPPARLLDSRLANSPWGGTPLVGGTTRTLQVAGSQGIPSGTTAAVMNVTVTGATQASFLTVFPGGTPPNASNLNFAAGQTIPNLVVVQLDGTGKASFRIPNGSTDVIVDVVGYYGPNGDKFHVLSPTRVLDSRLTAVDPVNSAWSGKPLTTTPRSFVMGGINPVPILATSVVMNTTVTGGTQNSFLTVYPDGQAVPTASNLNFAVGQTIPNLVFVKLGPANVNNQSLIDFSNKAGNVDVIADVVGYFAVQ